MNWHRLIKACIILSHERTSGGVTRPVSGWVTACASHTSTGVKFYFLISVTPAVPTKRIPHCSPCIVRVPVKQVHRGAFPRCGRRSGSGRTQLPVRTTNRFPIPSAEPAIRGQLGLGWGWLLSPLRITPRPKAEPLLLHLTPASPKH